MIFRGLQRGQNHLRLTKSHYSSATSAKGTLSQQDNLLRLPLPELTVTISKWLATTKPHLTENEFAKTKLLAESFINEAEPLQDYLRQKSQKKKNWFSDWWLDMAYLGYRAPLPVWSSPGIIMPPQDFSNSDEKWLSFTARLVEAVLDYKRKIDADLVKVDMSGSSPMDMVQYTQLYGATRIPGLVSDSQVVDSDPNYIIVMHRGNAFVMETKDVNGNDLNASQIYYSLQHTLAESKRLGSVGKIGLLTSDTRQNWYRAHQVLKVQDSETLSKIEGSSFVLCLDETLQEAGSGKDKLTSTALNGLHGMGTSVNGSNRWYDKALQFIVAKSGEVAICNEHSFAEAVPTMNIADHVIDVLMQDDNTNASLFTSAGIDIQSPTILSFKTQMEQLLPMIQESSSNLDSLVSDLDMKVLDYQEFGKEAVKRLQLSPDSFIQMGIQLAFNQMHQVPAATYESASTRIFAEGRTDVIRSCSEESLHFSKIFQSPQESLAAKKEALINAMKGHNSYAKMAVQGQGVDRHLQGLKMAATEMGRPIPELYKDSGYVRSSRMRLSTSQISSRHGSLCCYGPLELDGYGCSYSIGSNQLRFSISAMKSNQETDADEFASRLAKSLTDIHDLCIVTAKAKL